MGEGVRASRFRGGRRTACLAVLILIGAAALHQISPPPAPGAGDLILDRAARILGISHPGSGAAVFPSSTAWSGHLMAGLQEVLFRLSGGGNRALYVDSHHSLWMEILRGIWALLSALIVAGSARLAMAGSGPDRPGRPDADPSRRRAGAALAGAILLVSPILALGIRELAAFVPAAAVALWVADSAIRGRGGVSSGIAMGLVLAWFPFLWPLVPLALAAQRLHGASILRLSGLFGLALFLGLTLEPRHLTELGNLPALWVEEWRRGGGWGGAGGPGLYSSLTLSSVLGPVAFVLWLAGWTILRRTRRSAPALLSVGVWILLVLLPVLSGLRTPGSAQYASAALLAVWTGISIGEIRLRRLPAWLPWVAGLCALAFLAPERARFERAAREGASVREAVLRDLGTLIGSGDLWISDSALLPRVAAGNSIGSSRLMFVLPRDSRKPGRYDYAYWPRWYPGFRWVLLSSARVRENLARSGAELPRAFYGSLHAGGDLVQTWGSGEGEGYRLYRIREGSRWTHPLTEEELAGLRGRGGSMTWFLGNLGALYMDAGDPAAAAALFRQGIEWDSGAVSLYNNLGAAYLRDGEFEMAAAVFEDGLRVAPESVELLYNFALACMKQGLHDRAERLFRRVAASRPDYAPPHYELARIFQIRGQRGLAREALRRFLELDPGTPRSEDALRRLRALEEPEDGAAEPDGTPGEMPDRGEGAGG